MAQVQKRKAPRSGASGSKFDAGERFLTVGVVAELFGVTEVTIKNWVDAGQLLAARTVGGHRRIAASSVVDLLEQQGRPVPPALAQPKPVVLLATNDLAYPKSLRRAVAGRARVEVARGDYEALLAAGRVHPEVIVLDSQLSPGDPGRFVAALRADSASKDLALVVLATTATQARAFAPAQKGARGAASGGAAMLVFKHDDVAGAAASILVHLDRPASRRGPTRKRLKTT